MERIMIRGRRALLAENGKARDRASFKFVRTITLPPRSPQCCFDRVQITQAEPLIHRLAVPVGREGDICAEERCTYSTWDSQLVPLQNQGKLTLPFSFTTRLAARAGLREGLLELLLAMNFLLDATCP